MDDSPRLRQRIASLERRLMILDSVREQLAGEISRAKAGHRSLMRSNGDVLVGNPILRSALKLNDISHRARKHLRAAVAQFERFGDFGFALERTLALLVVAAPDDDPLSRRPEILLGAVERGDRDAVRLEAGRVEGATMSRATFDTALSKGRTARRQRQD